MGLFRNIIKKKPTIYIPKTLKEQLEAFKKAPIKFKKPECIPYEERIKSAIKTRGGLYPPQIVGIYFCTMHPRKDGGYPKWFIDNYGIEDPGAFYDELSRIGMIERKDNGKWEATIRGAKELEDNRQILWAHQHGFDAWIVAEKTAKYGAASWEEKVRSYLKEELQMSLKRHHARLDKNRSIFGDEFPDSAKDYLDQSFALDLRLWFYHLMQFEEEQGNKALAEKYHKKVKELDQISGR